MNVERQSPDIIFLMKKQMTEKNIVVKFAWIKLVLVQFAEKGLREKEKMANFIVVIAEKAKEN